jgi:hypothetical protein
LRELLDDPLGGLPLVVLVDRDELPMQMMMLKQPGGHASVLRGYRIDAGERIESARADVFEVPNGRRHHI